MKKHVRRSSLSAGGSLLIILAFSLLMTPVQSRGGDFDGVGGLVMGGFLLSSAALIATVAMVGNVIQNRRYRKKSAELNMEFNTYKAAVWYNIDPVKYQGILRAAQRHDLDGLKRLFRPIEQQVWGPHWMTERNTLYNELRAMLNRYGNAGRKVFVDKHPSFSLKALTHLFALYSAVTAIYNNKKLGFFSIAKILWNDIEKMDALLFENPLRYTGPGGSEDAKDQQEKNAQYQQQYILDALLNEPKYSPLPLFI